MKKALTILLAVISINVFAVRDGSRCIASPEKFAAKMKNNNMTNIVIKAPSKYMANAQGCADGLQKYGITAAVKEDNSLSELFIAKAQ